MTQAQALVLALKIVTVAGFLSLTAWMAIYTKWAAWWRDPIGQTLVAKTGLVAALLLITAMSLFFHFSRLTSWAAGWVDTGLIGLITPVMVWRIIVFYRVHAGKQDPTGHQRAHKPPPGIP